MMRQRPHTRTQCQDQQQGNQCPECREPACPPAGSSSSNIPPVQQTGTSTQTTSAFTGGEGLAGGFLAIPKDDPFIAPISTVSRGRATVSVSSTSGFSLPNEAGGGSSNKIRVTLLTELPAEILFKILSYMSFKEISHLRTVSRRFNEICASMLNSTFQRLQSQMLSRFQEIKTQMPRRESARRNHPLAQECDVVETLHMRLSLLQMTFGKHIERKHVCFFAGEILDEVQRIMRYIRQNSNQPPKGPNRAYIFMEDELFDLTTMAMEYFKENIEPTLPEITYFGADFLDFTTSFATPTKRRSVSGSTSILGNGLDSPCSSRASVAGSSVSEAWSTASTAAMTDMTDMVEASAGVQPSQPPQSNMVLRKRIRRIRQGMKRYNDQLVEVKKELKVCKSKMETQTKQVTEYSNRLEQYDQKFEESSRKFQTLLTELNKCKTELQYWRSKSTTLLALPSTCASCSAPLTLPSQSAEEAEAELKALANQGIFLTDENLMETTTEAALQVQTTSKPEFEHQHGEHNAGLEGEAVAEGVVVPAVVVDEAATTSTSLVVARAPGTSNLAALDGPPSPNLRSSSTSTCKSGPPSPVSAAVGRKRKSRDDLPFGDNAGSASAAAAAAGILQEEAASVSGGLIDSDLKRKNSLRGFSTVGSNSSAGSKNTRFKRPKTTSAI